MENLAGRENCDITIRKELLRCGISAVDVPKMNREVPASVVGQLDLKGASFRFERAWYYWCVEGRVPLPVAEKLYADPVGVTDIRVSGHCGCPAPKEYATWLTPEGKKCLPMEEKAGFDHRVETGYFSKDFADKYVFARYPSEVQADPYVTNYHIDTELGLYIFVQTLRRELGDLGS